MFLFVAIFLFFSIFLIKKVSFYKKYYKLHFSQCRQPLFIPRVIHLELGIPYRIGLPAHER